MLVYIMGNCLKTTIGIESFPLIENSDTMIHMIEANKETINMLSERINELEKNVNENFKAIADDIIYMDEKLNHSENKIGTSSIFYSNNHHPQESFNHQSSSKYGGRAPVSIQAEPAGPSDTKSDISL